MGYQQSFLQFESKEELVSELKKYKERNTSDDMARVYCVDRVIKNVEPFVKGDLVIVVGGERYEQRNPERIEEGLGIENVKSVVFIDNSHYWELADGDLGKFLDEHFEVLSEKETDELLN